MTDDELIFCYNVPMFTTLFPRGSLRRLVAGNTISQLVGRVVSAASIMIVSFLIAQRFGPEGYGDFVKITTYVGFFYLLADFGLNAIYLQRFMDSGEHSPSSSWQLLLGLRLVISGFLVFVALAILSFLPQGVGQGYTSLVRLGIVVLAPVIIAQAITTTTNALFQKMLRYDLATTAQNAGSVATLLFALFLYAFTPINGAFMGVAAIFLGSVVTSALALFLVRRAAYVISPLFDARQFLSYLAVGAPLGLTLVFNLIYFHSDSIVLTLTRSTHEVGIYGLAYKVFELLLVVPLFFMNTIYPLLLKAGHEDPLTSKILFTRSLQFLLVSSVALAAGMWIGAPLVTLVRPDFAESILPLRILILGLPIFFLSSLFMWLLIAQRKQWQLLAIHASAMLMNIGLNLAFIPGHGYIAAAWITGISELVILCISALFIFPLGVNERRTG